MPIQAVLTAQHRTCKAEFARIEQAAHRRDWEAAAQAASVFVADSEAHFEYEERALFPALQAIAPTSAGAVAVMLGEHAQMQQLFRELLEAAAARDVAALADAVEPLLLLLLMQQHNAKEENVLYPIAEQVLSGQLPAVASHGGVD